MQCHAEHRHRHRRKGTRMRSTLVLPLYPGYEEGGMDTPLRDTTHGTGTGIEEHG